MTCSARLAPLQVMAAGTATAAEADTADAGGGPQGTANNSSQAEPEQPAAGGKAQRAAGEEEDLGGDLHGDLEEYLGWIRSLSRDKLRRELHKRGLSECRTKPLVRGWGVFWGYSRCV